MPALTNRLIESLPRVDRHRMLAICEPVELALSQVISESDAATRHVYFPTGGFISLVTQLDGKPMLEVGMVGTEGMYGTHVALGARSSPLRAVVQGPGLAARVATADFQRELKRSLALQQVLNRYIHVSMLQFASMAACLRYHHIGPRLARWLLMTHDRAHADTFRVTQEFLAYMLGVRRVGITDAAGGFQRLRMINYRRGEMTILSRQELERVACSCYRSDLKAYAAFLH